MGEGPAGTVEEAAHDHHARLALRDTGRHLRGRALKLAGYLLVAFVVLKLIPALKGALQSLGHVSVLWLLAALALELLSEMGFVVAWTAIVDPENVLGREGGGRRMDNRVAWTQLAGGLILPGGSWGGVGVGALILRRFGMPRQVIAERQFNLSFLNTAIDALALIAFGVALAVGILAGEQNLFLTLLPAGIAAGGIAAALVIARRASADVERLQPRHPKVAVAFSTLASAVEDTRRLVFHRGSWVSVLGIVAYFGLDVLVLWSAFLAVHAHPFPGLPVVTMAYIIGALGGSVPLPASAGTVGGIAGMLVLYGVAHNAAVAAVLLHQAIGLLVPLIGGGVAYAILRRRLGPMRVNAAVEPVEPQAT
jgi:uncharacterized membrane protein YbhN (UPF0104 family)